METKAIPKKLEQMVAAEFNRFRKLKNDEPQKKYEIQQERLRAEEWAVECRRAAHSGTAWKELPLSHRRVGYVYAIRPQGKSQQFALWTKIGWHDKNDRRIVNVPVDVLVWC